MKAFCVLQETVKMTDSVRTNHVLARKAKTAE